MKAVIYARVSSTDESQSYDRQIADLKRYAEYLNLEVEETFAEHISGFRKGLDERVEFKKMQIYIKQNDIKHILISELSRLSRRFIDAVTFIHDCTKNGVSIHIHKERLSTLNEDGSENGTAKMLISILSNIAEEESKTLSFRIKSGKQFSASQGGGFSKKIYGYDRDENNRPILHEEQAPLVRKIFELYNDGIGSPNIAIYLNENYDTKEWKGASVYSIVRNSFYKGERRYNDLIIDVPAIVEEAVWNRANEMVNSRKRFAGKRKHVNPFAGFIYCQCGARMNQIIIPSGNLNLYRCSKTCGIKSINRPFLIHEVKKLVENNAKLTQDKTVRSKLRNQLKSYASQISKKERRILQLKKLTDKNYERFLLGKLDEELYEKYELKFTDESSDLDNDIKELKYSWTSLDNTLSNEITHYSDDLETFKSQLIGKIQYIYILEEFGQTRIHGFGKMLFKLYRGSELQKWNNRKKKRKKKG